MRITDHFKKAVGLWPPKAPYNALRHALSGGGDVSGLPALLRQYPDAVRWEKKGDMQPLHFALWQRNYAAAEILIEHDRSILSDKNKSGGTLLHEYASRGETKPLGFLVREGANVDSIDGSGRTPLHHAALKRYGDDAVPILLRYGARPDIKDSSGRTPLMIALMAGNTSAAEALLQKPYVATQIDNYGRTLLMAAAESGLAHFIPPLLRAGANIAETNPLGETALDLAIKKKHGTAALQLLQAYIPDEIDDKKRRKLGNLIRPLDGSAPALKSIGLRPSPKPRQTWPLPKF